MARNPLRTSRVLCYVCDERTLYISSRRLYLRTGIAFLCERCFRRISEIRNQLPRLGIRT